MFKGFKYVIFMAKVGLFFYTGVCGDSLLEQAPTSASPVRNMQMHKRD